VNFHILAAFCADLLLYLQAIQLYLLPATLQIHYSAWVILRREYPGVIVEVDENGDEFKRPALDWADYFHKNPKATEMTRGQKVVSEFWVRYLCSI